MTELELYKFINENNIEWCKQDNNGTEDVLIFPSFYEMKAFKNLLPSSIFDGGGIECTMMDGYFCFWMKDICENYGLKLENVFVGKGWT